MNEFDNAQYEAEVQERWGDSEAYKESGRRTKSYTSEDWKTIKGQQEAIEAGYDVRTALSYFESSGRAKAIGETEGLLKFVADAKTGELLGGHILGPHADDLIHQVVVAMYNRGTAESIHRSITIHPTLSEKVKETAKKLK